MCDLSKGSLSVCSLLTDAESKKEARVRRSLLKTPRPLKSLTARTADNRDDSAGWRAKQTVFNVQVKTQHLTTAPSLSLPLSRPLFIQILQTGYFFQFSTFTSFVRERHYACVIMQFITNNRFVYGGPRLSPALSAAFENNNNNT